MKISIPKINWAKKYFLLLFLLPFLAGQAKSSEPLVIDYFFESGCRECKIISDTVLPALSNAFYGKYVLNHRDLGIMTNYALLARCQESTGSIKNELVYMTISERLLFSGFKEIQSDFIPAVDKALYEQAITQEENEAFTQRIFAKPSDLSGIALAKTEAKKTISSSGETRDLIAKEGENPSELPALIKKRFQRLTLFGVLAAGLIDGINPCAISTLIFLVSVLVIAGFKNSRLIAVGAEIGRAHV